MRWSNHLAQLCVCASVLLAPFAAQAATESDLLAKTQADLAALQAKSAELADQYLRAKAEAENARRRADDERHPIKTIESDR